LKKYPQEWSGSKRKYFGLKCTLNLLEKNGKRLGIKSPSGNKLWFDDDGTVFLRKAGEDVYEARYGGYLQSYIVPSFHGVLTGLAV